jgi:hypothetical protein
MRTTQVHSFNHDPTPDATVYICASPVEHVPPHTPPPPPYSLPMSTLLSFPEEVLERILALCVDAQTDAFANPSWHTRQVSRRASSILLVNKTFLRIATPLLYSTVVIRSAHQLATILDNVFRPNPELAAFVKTVAISGGSYDGLDEFVRLCVNLEEFDMTLDNSPWEGDVRERFGQSLMGMKKIKSLVVRKDAYLTQEKPKLLMNQLSNAITSWTSLVSFLLSIDTRTTELTPWNSGMREHQVQVRLRRHNFIVRFRSIGGAEPEDRSRSAPCRLERHTPQCLAKPKPEMYQPLPR